MLKLVSISLYHILVVGGSWCIQISSWNALKSSTWTQSIFVINLSILLNVINGDDLRLHLGSSLWSSRCTSIFERCLVVQCEIHCLIQAYWLISFYHHPLVVIVVHYIETFLLVRKRGVNWRLTLREVSQSSEIWKTVSAHHNSLFTYRIFEPF